MLEARPWYAGLVVFLGGGVVLEVPLRFVVLVFLGDDVLVAPVR
ncbi:hypothetical protein BCU30_008560 [Vibrio lentus]|nr:MULTISPECIES: hypothetical protein [Vibrio]